MDVLDVNFNGVQVIFLCEEDYKSTRSSQKQPARSKHGQQKEGLGKAEIEWTAADGIVEVQCAGAGQGLAKEQRKVRGFKKLNA